MRGPRDMMFAEEFIYVLLLDQFAKTELFIFSISTSLPPLLLEVAAWILQNMLHFLSF